MNLATRRLVLRPRTFPLKWTRALSSGVAPSRPKFKQIGLATSVCAGSCGAIAWLPMFSHTREGLFYAWNWNDYHYDMIEELENWAWQFWFGTMGLFLGGQSARIALRRASNAGQLSAALKTPVIVAFAMLGAKLTVAFSKPGVSLVLTFVHLVQNLAQGLAVDILDYDADQVSWAKVKGDQSSLEGQVPYEGTTGDTLRDLMLVKGDLNDLETAGPYRHKLLLVRELASLRQKEAVIKKMDLEHNKRDALLSEIKAKKAALKTLALQLHNAKITKLFSEVLQQAVDKLQSLREEQLKLISEGQGNLNKVRSLDEEKAKLKAKAKLGLGVKLAHHAQPSIKWKHFYTDMQAARKVSS